MMLPPPDEDLVDFQPAVVWWVRAKLIEVVDGDTYKFLIDGTRWGYRGSSERLWGVDTWEIFSGTPENRVKGVAAKDFVSGWFQQHLHASLDEYPWYLYSEKDRQTFARYISKVYCGQGHSLVKVLKGSEHEKVVP